MACFYIQPRIVGEQPRDKLYRAVYLMQRTLKDFVSVVALKCNIEPTEVLQIIRVTRNGLHVLVDDQFVAELPEGQDMTAEFCSVDAPDSPVKPSRQWDSGADDIQVDGELPTLHNKPSSGYELKLLF